MLPSTSYPSRSLRGIFMAAALAAAALLTGCGSMYVDTATKEVPVTEFKKPSQLKAVQLTFDFQTNGAANTQATKFLADTVSTQVKESGLFSAVESAPAAGLGVLSIKIDNIPLTKDAMSKGFVTGLTFGIAGSAVTDGYICTVQYLAAGQTKVITSSAKHAIHTTIGNANPPENAKKSANAEQAVRTMTREILSNALRDLAASPDFN